MGHSLMKILALYLPQFHEVKENNEWWGDGFTEWTTVSNAKPLFHNHKQPVVPIDRYYYDLLDRSTMEWQDKLIKRSGLDGICIYHYWFKNGRQILEKPAENLLRWTDIDINFCFSWANETWARTWSRLNERNTWASIYETQINSGDGILLEQKYGDVKDWKKHFEYLLPFFKDKRYIKINNRPVMEFHKLKDIYCFENMIDLWNQMARDNGFDGIYAVGNQPRQSQENFIQMKYICEPGEAMREVEYEQLNGVKSFDFDDIWGAILSEDFSRGSVGAFVNYDDTPRHGSKGSLIMNATPEKAKKYISNLKRKNENNGREIMFLNAWNEWGEGMHLEPDEEYKYSYLDAVHDAINGDRIDNTVYSQRLYSRDEYKHLEQSFEKEKLLRDLLDKWMWVIKKGDSFKKYLSGLGNIGVYGYGILGRHIVEDILENECDIKFVVDRKSDQECIVPIYNQDMDWPSFDTMIVTAAYEYGKIYEIIKNKGVEAKILSIEYIVNELLD